MLTNHHLVVGLIASLALGGCASDSQGPSTGGERIILHTQVRAPADLGDPHTNGMGWTVTIERAAIAVEALYYFDGEPAFVRDDRRPLLERWFGERVAWAHPGHYQSGNAMGQMLTPSSVDLFAGPAALADAEAVTGTYRSARLLFGTSSEGPAAATLAGSVGYAQGTATKDGSDPVHFRLEAGYDEVSASASAGAVDGCAFEQADVATAGTVTVSVDPKVWINFVDFTGVAPGTPEEPTTIAKGETARKGFALGLTQLSAYHFQYSQQ